MLRIYFSFCWLIMASLRTAHISGYVQCRRSWRCARCWSYLSDGPCTTLLFCFEQDRWAKAVETRAADPRRSAQSTVVGSSVCLFAVCVCVWPQLFSSLKTKPSSIFFSSGCHSSSFSFLRFGFLFFLLPNRLCLRVAVINRSLRIDIDSV